MVCDAVQICLLQLIFRRNLLDIIYSETWATGFQYTRRHVPEDSNFSVQFRENLRYRVKYIYIMKLKILTAMRIMEWGTL
jgi:hypothetical protein